MTRPPRTRGRSRSRPHAPSRASGPAAPTAASPKGGAPMRSIALPLAAQRVERLVKTANGVTDADPTSAARRAGAAGMKIRVVVAEDHPLVREGVIRALERDPGIEVIAQADSGITAM